MDIIEDRHADTPRGLDPELSNPGSPRDEIHLRCATRSVLKLARERIRETLDPLRT